MRSIFFWRVLISSILVLLLANIASLAAYTYVGKNTYISMEMDDLEPEAALTRQIYEEYKAGLIDETTFNRLIEKQTIASGSAILIADQLGKTLIVRDVGSQVEVQDFGVYFDAEIQNVLRGQTVKNDNLVLSNKELAISVGVPIRDTDATVTGGIFIIKQVDRIQTAYQQLSDALMVTTVLVLPVFMLLLVIGTNSISRPLMDMSRTAIEMSKGHFDVRADESAMGETGILARALNMLCENLAQTIHQLQNEKRQLHHLLTSFTDGVAAIDRLGCLTHYNPALKDMFGAVDVETPMDLIPDQVVWDAFESVISSQQTQSLNYSLPGNRKLWISIVPVMTESGDCTGAVGLFKDVTEFERLEQTRRDYVANVSHELRTPLTAVRGLLEPLADGLVKDEESRKRYYDIMLREVMRLSRLITDLLELSRLQSGSEYMDLSAVNLQELLEEIQMNYQVEAKQRGIALELSAENLPYAMTDRDRVEQVLVILIDNAMRYTPEGGSITISAKVGDLIVVSVSDTGCGIAAEELSHLFERFYKVDKSRKDGGTGLGLSIAKQIIDMLGEQITVESTVGEGTSFHFTLKRYVSNAIALGPSGSEIVYSDEIPFAKQNTVLLTGDEDAPYEVIDAAESTIHEDESPAKQSKLRSFRKVN